MKRLMVMEMTDMIQNPSVIHQHNYPIRQLNVSKTKELVVDCSEKQEWCYQPVRISGTTVERVDSFRYLGVHISQDLSWSRHTNSLAKKARQHLYHLRCLRDFRLPSKVLRNFYTCTIESILTGNITVWFGNSTKQDRQALQRVVRSAEHITHMELPDLQSIYYKRCQTKARRIVKDPTHPNNRLFSLLREQRSHREPFLPLCWIAFEFLNLTSPFLMQNIELMVFPECIIISAYSYVTNLLARVPMGIEQDTQTPSIREGTNIMTLSMVLKSNN
ncbi:hypothetical protein P4O66_001642 [Electrophorus voltai]|uniref:Alkylated DNA repair protein AlkB homologue 8 N-terminal domain-containing protein n=1 Tax=Electrophorus voltai TaxID=2609070 RepID=A0AAD9DT13_9TELE|nr:hypothetical protein P4O66_001642 [Electrophorus voltai]